MGRNKKDTQIPVDATDVEQPNIETTQPQSGGIDSDFLDMQNAASDFSPENCNDQPDMNSTDGGKTFQMTASDKVKMRMFLGLFCFILVGLNVFILNKVFKTDVPFEKLKLEDSEVDSLLPYLENEEIVQMINSINPLILGVIQFEYMIFMKFNLVKDNYKIVKSKEVEK